MEKKLSVRKIIKQALKEDIGTGDITTALCIPPKKKGKATIFSKQKGVLCGIDIAKEIFKTVDASLKFRSFKSDGRSFKTHEKIVQISGALSSILTAERVVLNFLSLLSGVATHTRKFTDEVKGTRAKIRGTRKTTPGLRVLEKYAVRTGGGTNHRSGLWDAVLVKDNHLKSNGMIHKGKINNKKVANAMAVIRKAVKSEIEIEVENMNEFKEIIKYKPDVVMLDNFDIKETQKAVQFRDKYFPGVKLEASGGVDIHKVKKIAETGVDFIAVGSITHSSESIDFSLEVDE